ncbi:protein translocase subunit SecF [Patescibacteria group bacterium]|nr:protein translocase subunit SecF [Patescibacteria group bacterium]
MKWMKFRILFFAISLLFLIPGIFSLIKFGLKPSIDFSGGSLLELSVPKEIDSSKIEQTVEEAGFIFSSIQSSGDNSFLLKLEPIKREDVNLIISSFEEEGISELRFETVGPTLGQELIKKTIWAIILAAGFIMAYVAWQFKNAKFGICAILAMFHDTFILLGSFSLLGHFLGVEVDTLFVTAVLTILSFSVHDTVVVYDRIRESQKFASKDDFEQIANKAVTETLPRSLNNSLTIIFMLVALLLLGGQSIKFFTAALLIGTISGTYSSTFTAVPFLVVWTKIEEKKKS